MHISWLPKRTKSWSWKLQHMCCLIQAMSRLHTAFDFWSSVHIRIAYFCMPQTVPLFTSLVHLGLDPRALGGGVLWEVLLSGWVSGLLSTTYRDRYHCLLKHNWRRWKTTFYINLTSWARALKVGDPASVSSAAWQQRKVLDPTFGCVCKVSALVHNI